MRNCFLVSPSTVATARRKATGTVYSACDVVHRKDYDDAVSSSNCTVQNNGVIALEASGRSLV
jgi:hypothetical protein